MFRKSVFDWGQKCSHIVNACMLFVNGSNFRQSINAVQHSNYMCTEKSYTLMGKIVMVDDSGSADRLMFVGLYMLA